MTTLKVALFGTILLFCVDVSAAMADDTIGNFIVYSQETRFGDGAGMSAWMLSHGHSMFIACDKNSGKFTVAVGSQYDPRVPHLEKVSVEVNVNGNTMLKTIGTAPPVSDYEKAVKRNGWLVALGWSVSLKHAERTIDIIRDAENVTFRLSRPNGQTFDLDFDVRKPRKVIDIVLNKKCGTPAPGAALPEAGNWQFGLNKYPDLPFGELTLFSPVRVMKSQVRLICNRDRSWQMIAHWDKSDPQLSSKDPALKNHLNPIISYSVDGRPIVRLTEGKSYLFGRYDFDETNAEHLLADLAKAKSTFAFSVGKKQSMAVVDFTTGLIHDDIIQLLEHCPLIHK